MAESEHFTQYRNEPLWIIYDIGDSHQTDRYDAAQKVSESLVIDTVDYMASNTDVINEASISKPSIITIPIICFNDRMIHRPSFDDPNVNNVAYKSRTYMYNSLKSLVTNKYLLTLVTPQHIFDNMLLVGFKSRSDIKSIDTFMVELVFKHMTLVEGYVVQQEIVDEPDQPIHDESEVALSDYDEATDEDKGWWDRFWEWGNQDAGPYEDQVIGLFPDTQWWKDHDTLNPYNWGSTWSKGYDTLTSIGKGEYSIGGLW